MVIDFSTLGVIKEQPTLILCSADGKAIQTLGYAFNLKADICYNEASTITFDIPAYVDGKATPHYDDIVGMRMIDMSGWGRFVLMNPSVHNNGVKEMKSCKAYSLEYELTYKKVFFDESTYNLWDPFAPDNTVLGMIMEDLPSWTIGHVDEDLIGKYRTFDASNVNVYNFMKSTLQKSYGCIFDFDTYTRTINVRSTANEAISKPVYLSMENLVKEIEISEDTENIFTVLDVSGGEGVDIRSVNPLGTNKIYNLDYFMTPSYFDQGMIDKWNDWKKSFEAYQLTYYNISVERMLVASAITAAQAKLSDIQNIDLGALLNERAVYVEYLARLSARGSSEYNQFQSKLDDVNARIAVANQSISEQKSTIASLQSRNSELKEQLISIKNAVSLRSVFTPSELMILDRYFKEESIEESTFVVSEVDSYSDENTSNAISNVNVKISDGQLSAVSSETGNMIYAIKGGTLSFTSNGVSVSAGVVKAHIERRTDGTFIMSAFLNQGHIGDTTFPSGNISMTGSSTSFTESGNVVNLAVSTGQMYFTRNATDYEKQSVAWDLFEYGKETLASLAYPSYTFNVSSGNFMSMDEFIGFVRQLELGQRIYLNTDKKVLEPIFIGIEIDFENLSSLELQFSDKYSSSDSSFRLVELLDQSISMGKTVDTNKLTYSAFVESGASTKVKEFMESALDVAKNAILSSTGQGVSWDDTGFHLRKYLDSSNQSAGFEDEEIWMINNSIVFTDDGWQTAKMAIGKIIDENIAKYPESADILFNPAKTYYFLNDDGNYQVWDGGESDWADRPILYEKDSTAYGIVAPYLVGTILAGQYLVITTEAGDFRVDSSGVHIDSMRFYITHGGSTYDTTLADALTKTEHDLADFKDTYIENGYLNASKLKGVINSITTDMESGNGNVLFDNDGIWLMNGTQKNNSTKAIWMNESGILLGHGAETTDPASNWDWTTAIGHDGIVSDAIAGKKISGIEIYGGSININDHFIVDRLGNLTANNGTFRGVVKGAIFQDANGNPMMNGSYQFTSDYLNLRGLEIINGAGETTLEIDSGGNIAMRGNIYMGAGSSINWSDVTETGDKPYATSDDITNALGEYVTKSEVNASIDTYLNSPTGQAAIVTMVSGTYQTKSDMENYAKKTDLDSYIKQTDLYAEIGAYIDTSTGRAKVVSAVSGTYQKKSEMGNYVTATSLNSSITQYIDTSTGKAKIVSACSGTYITSDDLSGYAKKSAVTAVEQSVSDVEASISLTASYGSGSIGSNVRALLTLVTNADSSRIKIKADSVEIDGSLYLKASDYLVSGTTTIKGSKIETSDLYIQQLRTTVGDYIIDYYGNVLAIGGGTSGSGHSFTQFDYIDMMVYEGIRIGFASTYECIFAYESSHFVLRPYTTSTQLDIGDSSHPIRYLYVDYLYVDGVRVTGPTLKSTDIKKIYADGSTSDYIALNSSNAFVPSSSGFNLGTTVYPFETAYIGTGSVYYWKIDADAILPSTSTTSYFDIGSSSYPVNKVYVRSLYIGGTLLDTSKYLQSTNFSNRAVYMGGNSSFFIVATTSRELRPNSSSSYDAFYLGTSSFYWQHAYIGSVAAHIGSTSSSKLGFFGATPVSKQSVSDVSDLIVALRRYGLIY